MAPSNMCSPLPFFPLINPSLLVSPKLAAVTQTFGEADLERRTQELEVTLWLRLSQRIRHYSLHWHVIVLFSILSACASFQMTSPSN